jgi:hypothetical protein
MIERIKTDKEKEEEKKNPPSPDVPKEMSEEEVRNIVERVLELKNKDIMMQFKVFDWATNTATGDGKHYIHIDRKLNESNLVYVHAEVITAGTTNTTDIQIANVTQSVDMLSTKLTIDTGETGSDTAAAPAVIDRTKDNVSENDLLRVDVDAVSSTPAKGLIITLGFEVPTIER